MKLDTSTQVIDVETAVKGGLFGGGGGGGGVVSNSKYDDKTDLKKMMEELESDEIPSVFICPISLDPMLDPVTLCTGQTYDKSNIQRWFSLGKLTCPTTMQELWDDTLTPNSTLRHLIHSWFSNRYQLFKKRAEDFNGRASDLVDCLKRGIKGQTRIAALKELNKLVSTHPSVKTTVSSSKGISVISSLLGPFTSHSVGSEAVAIIVNLEMDSECKRNLMQPAKISLVTDMLNEGTVETKINCTRFLESLMGDNNFRVEIVSSLSLLVGILRLVKDRRNGPNGVFAGLRILRRICSYEEIRGLVVSVGAVNQIVEQLANLNAECLELALEILDDIAGVPEGRLALKECAQTIPSMVRLLMRVSEKCTQHALSILWAVCKLAPEECASIAVEAGLAAKLLLVIQSGCNQTLKQRSAELLKLCSLNYTATLFISKCKLTRTIQ